MLRNNCFVFIFSICVFIGFSQTIYIHNNTCTMLLFNNDSTIEQRYYYNDIAKVYNNEPDVFASNISTPFVHFAKIINRSKDTLQIKDFNGVSHLHVFKDSLMWNQKVFYKTSVSKAKERFLLDEKLKLAIEKNDLIQAEKLILQGACVNAIAKKYYINDKLNFGVYYYNVPFIAIAAYEGNLEMLKLLLKNGANLKCNDENGNSVLIYATMSGSLALVEFICKHGIDANATNSYGKNPLNIASNYNYADIVNYLKQVPNK